MATAKKKGPDRASPPTADELRMFADSLRRCAFCFGLNKDHGLKEGQIAHVDQDRSNSKYANLAWLCLPHHNTYDGKTSQSKNLTRKELLHFRDMLYKYNAELPISTQVILASHANTGQPTVPSLSEDEIKQIRQFLKFHKGFFEYIFHERENLAFAIRSDSQDTLAELQLSWGEWQTFDNRVRDVQMRLGAALRKIYHVFDPQSYDLVGGYIRIDKQSIPQGTFEAKRDELRSYIEELENVYIELRELATI